MKPHTSSSFSPLILSSAFIALVAATTIWAQDNSHARIVRLSFTEGEVTVQRPDVQVWTQAPVNTPLQEGFRLSTGDGSFAEIQFENGGTLRLGERSLLDLTRLERTSDGATVNQVDLRRGYATFHPLPSDLGESLQVGTPYGTVTGQGGAEFRIDLDKGAQRVEVFNGAAEVQSNLGSLRVEKGSTLLLQASGTEPMSVSQGITKDDWDNWVDDREAQLQMPPNAPSPGSYADDSGGATYGWNDLLQYGTWYNVPGWGYGWTPARVGNGWSPYSTGQWCWYPGLGYTWIGAEPWGWLPYHYGGWDFVPGKGWVWFPGSLRSWSPGRVTWYHGPDWVGWTPRHMKDGGVACGDHCGGGVVSTSTFRGGGKLDTNVMLGFSPTSGERVREPGIPPTPGTKLTGSAVSYGTPAPPNSTIIYDPQNHGYVNSGRVATQPSQPANAGPIQPVPVGERPHEGRPEQNPVYNQPVPVGGREPPGRTLETQGYSQPNPAIGANSTRPGYSTPRGATYAAPASNGNAAKPAPAGSYGNPSLGRVGGGTSGATHGGGGQAGGSHTGGGGGGGSSAAGHH